MYKMIMIDLDGTLYNDEKQVPEKNIEMINRVYNEKGVIPVITTGRGIYTAELIANKIGDALKEYAIASNGAVIKNINKNKYIKKQTISETGLLEIVNVCKKYNFYVCVQTLDQSIINHQEQEKVLRVYKNMGDVPRFEKDLYNYILSNKLEVFSVSLDGDEKLLRQVKQHLDNSSEVCSTDICYYTMNPGDSIYKGTYIDINSNNTDKASSINILADYLNIKKEEIMVMGDGSNDIQMFENGGFRVAMENAVDIIKQKADFISKTNNEAGVGYAIKKLFFNI